MDAFPVRRDFVLVDADNENLDTLIVMMKPLQWVAWFQEIG